MKTLKLLVLFFLFLCNSNFSLYSQEHNNGKEIQLEKRTIKIKDETGNINDEGVPIKRSIQLQPAYAYLYNNVVSIDFIETFSTATITITNETTGETVYSETCSNSTNLNINLDGESSGSYLIEIESTKFSCDGCFNL